MSFFHPGMRELQDRFEGRAVPDRLADNRMRTAFSDTDRQFIESSSFFFLSTATDESVDCSFINVWANWKTGDWVTSSSWSK